MSQWTKLKETADIRLNHDVNMQTFCSEMSLNFPKIQRFIDAALLVDNLNMSMAREDMEQLLISEYNEAKKALLNDPT